MKIVAPPYGSEASAARIAPLGQEKNENGEVDIVCHTGNGALDENQ